MRGKRIAGLFAAASMVALGAAGAGIGLYVCRRLVEVMDGRIWAEPAPDTGSVFAFRLPVAHE